MIAKLEQELSKLKQGDHICLVYENAAEQLATVVLFIIEGIAREERCVYIIDDPNIEDAVVQALTAAGVDVVQERRRGSMRLLTSQSAYLRAGEFAPQAMLDWIRQMEIDALADGFSGLRLTAEPTWSFGSEPGCDRLIEYEALLNQLPTYSKSVFLCQYHQSRFGMPCIHDILRTHPVAILGEQVCPNPYYEPPELVLSQEPQPSAEYKRKRVEWWISQFKRARVAEQERERAKIAQRESEGRFREIVDLIPAAVYVCDKFGKIQLFNRKAVELWGRAPRPDEDVRFCGAIQHFRTDGSVIPRDELPIVETVHNGTPVRNKEVVIERADGSRVVVMVNIAPIRNAEGAPVGAINCFLDVTERRQAEERLRQSERRLAEAQRVAQIGSWERDLRTNEVAWSDELYRLFGLQAHEVDLSYQQFLQLVMPQDVDRTRTLVDEAIRERRPFSFDYRITRADGGVRVLHDRGGVILNKEGEPIRLVGTCQDVTEPRQAEQALQEYSTRLQTLSRRLLEVQEKERRHLARELHDEFGQVLATITLHLHGARGLAGEAARPRLDECATLLQQAGEQVRSLALELRPTMLDTLGLEATLRWLAEQHQQRTASEVQVVGHLSGTPLAPELAIACFRVAQESITNVARHATARQVWIELSQSESMLELVVRDNGVGFEVASTQEQAATRGGLGLMGMRERVEILGGTLKVISEPGRGTRIRASFPVNESPNQPADLED
jgi:PAS domain S-box-containing protein